MTVQATSHIETTATLVDLLRRHAREEERAAYTFLLDGGQEREALTFRDLDRRARAIGAALRERLDPGERALLVHPPGLEFVAAFFGCLYAGVVAVPAYPPKRHRALGRFGAIVDDAGARLLLSTGAHLKRLDAALEARYGDKLGSLATDGVPEDGAREWKAPAIDGGTVAFLQYTSGSTSTPKGVMVRHADLLANERMIRRAFRQSAGSVIVGWLPLYHDMGLIGNILQPLYLGARCVLMSPAAFLQNPLRWLEAITRYRATTSGGPNFAYDLCVRKIPAEARHHLDLSSWRVAFNGAEPVHAETLERFTEAFAPHGFRAEAFQPCYGLAEATLLVSGAKASAVARPELLDVDRSALEEDRVVLGQGVGGDAGRSQRLVGCGRPAEGMRILAVDPATCRPVKTGRIGEVWVAGAGVTGGYWNRPQENEETFGGRLAGSGEGPFLRTGDLGFLHGGELVLTGRLKDLIILRGRNYYPQDIELAVGDSHPDLRLGVGAAFTAEIDGEERLVVVHEVTRRRDLDPAAVLDAARRAVAESCELQLYEMVLIRIGTLPKTSSGKVRRSSCRDLWRRGELVVVSRSAEPAVEPSSAPGSAEESGAEGHELFLRREVARLSKMDPQRVASDQPLYAFGLDSLMAIELKTAVEEGPGVELSVAALLEGPTLSELAGEIHRRSAAASRPGSAVPVFPDPKGADSGPLSRGQQALWFLHRLAPASSVHHIVGAARIRGPLDTARLRRSFLALAERHPALRTTFHERRGQPEQLVHPEPEVELVELGPCPDEPPLAGRWLEETERPFDLERGPLLRLVLSRRSAAESTALLVVHHLVADFWSVGILIRELEVLYGNGAGLAPPPELTPLDFARLEERRLSGPEGERLWDYWREALGGTLPILDLPTDRPRPPVRTSRGGSRDLRLERDLTAGLEALARERGATLFMGLLTLWSALLHRATHQQEVLVGSPTAGRTASGLSSVAGYFVNPVVLRARPAEASSLGDLLGQVRQTALGAFAHQDFPLALLAERLQPERDPSIPPVFQVMFVFQKAHLAGLKELSGFALGEAGALVELGDLRLESLPLARRQVEFDLTLAAAEIDGEIRLSFQYNRDLFDPTTVERLARQFRTLATAASDDPRARLDALPLLSAAGRHQVLREWNVDATAAAQHLCLHELFERQAAESPERTALVAGRRRLSYRELDRRSLSLARRLRDLGVAPETRVGVLLERTSELPVALLAVLRAGGAYVPLDPSYPPARLELMLEDSDAAVLVTRRGRAAGLSVAGVRLLELDRKPGGDEAGGSGSPARPVRPDNLAYLIYTSGSTGRPKGVAIRHGSAVARMVWAGERFDEASLTAVLASTSVCFDLSVFELFVPLSRGGRVVLVRDALELTELAGAAEPTLVNTVPSAMAELLRRSAVPPSVRTVNLAGEPLERRLVDGIYATGTVERVFNLYGPSEDTTYSTESLVAVESSSAPTIGRPLVGTRVQVVDRRLEPLPPGVAGELLLGGAGQARGYHRRPALTAQKFVPDFSAAAPGERLYRTGDLALRRHHGELVFLGRVDHQVKVRGFRIELGEIEVALGRCPGVAETVVVASADRRLVAYLAPSVPAAILEPEALREFLRRRLPEHMLPSFFVVLPALPRTPNGKVDRRALPEPRLERRGIEAPLTGTEETLAGIWAEVLRLERVGRDDHFFELGGHSLLAVRVIARISEVFGLELPLLAFFEAPTPARLAARLDELGRAGSSPEALPELVASGAASSPLSFAQERIWFLEHLEPEPLYNELLALDVAGRPAAGALGRALGEIRRRHAVLRTRFTNDGGRRAEALPAGPFTLPAVDLAGLPPARRRPVVEELSRREGRRRFDLRQGELLRAVLCHLDREKHVLVLVAHHIAIDGWSWRLLLAELASLYGAFLRGEPSPLPELAVQYGDFARWQRGWLTEDRVAAEIEAWRERLRAAPRALELATDRPRPPVETFRGGEVPFHLDRELGTALVTLGRRFGATPFATWLAAFQILLHRLTGQSVIPVGSPVSQRRRRELEEVIGIFLNTLVLPSDLGGDPRCSDALEEVRETVLWAHAHQDLPFESLVQALVKERDLSRSALFQVAFVLHSEPVEIPAFQGLELRRRAVDTGLVKFDLVFDLTAEDGGFEGRLQYNTELFDRTTALRLAGAVRVLAAGMVRDDASRLGALPFLDRTERHQLLLEWNDSETAEEPVRAVQDQFAACAAARPHAVAVSAAGAVLSYGELSARARGLAGRLREMGVGPEDPVGLLMRRSPGLMVAIVGVLEAGAAYVPMDLEYPSVRLRQMIDDTGMPVLLSDVESAADLGPETLRVLRLEGAGEAYAARGRQRTPGPPRQAGPRQAGPELAYVIFTSGSTGRPKGVMIPHAGLANLVAWHRRLYGLTPEDRATQVAGLGFDASVWEIWPYLTCGARLHLPADEIRSAPEELKAWLEAEGVTLSFLPTPLAESALASGWPENMPLRALLTGGDRLHGGLRPSPPTALVNHYGPTENTVVASWDRVRDEADPPIGRPIANSRIQLADRALRPVPVGVAGELLIGGRSLARGYWGRPALSAERFVPDPFAAAEGERLYRTGDLARFLSDGRIRFLGRVDHQVQVRGFRIELGEIEAVLSRRPDLREAVVTAPRSANDERFLAAYLVPRQMPGPDAGELAEDVARTLPSYMVPAVFIPLPELPLTANGKVDRAALPAPVLGEPVAPVAPRSPEEELAASIWADVLGLETVGIHDDFFARGGHSLLATQLISRLRSAFSVELELRELFENPTVAGLTRRLGAVRREGRTSTELPIERVPRTPPPAASFAQERLWFLDRFAPGQALYNVPVVLDMTGHLDLPVLEWSLAQLVARHETLRATFAVEEGRVVQRIAPRLDLCLPLHDLSDLHRGEALERAWQLAAGVATGAFDLEAGPLFRTQVVRLGAERHLLVLTLHHIVCDGTSMEILIRELAAFYRGGRDGRSAALPELPIQYADFAAWQRRWLESGVLEEQLAYWRQRLGEEPPVLDLPVDRGRPPQPTFAGARSPFVLAVADALTGLGRREGTTMYMTLLAAFATLLHRLSGQDDLALGSPAGHRRQPETESLVGFFVNPLALRLDLSGDPELPVLLQRVRRRTLEAYAHGDVPFERLVEMLRPERHASPTPLFQTVLAFRQALPELELPELEVEMLELDTGTAKFDLTLNLVASAGTLSGWLEFSTEVFDATTAERFLACFRTLLCAIAVDPARRLSELPLLDKAREHQVLTEWNDTGTAYPRGATLPELFAREVEREPERVALLGRAGTWTYGEIDGRARRLAGHLLGLGVGPEARVGLCVRRSPEMVVAVLGILKAGGAYVPLDPDYPRDRLDFMLRDSGVEVLVTEAELTGRLPRSAVRHEVLLDREAAEIALAPAGILPSVRPDNLAYVVYTSGSTGRPKGVSVSHRAVVRLVRETGYADLGRDEVFLQFAPISFDASTLEIWGPLLNGARLAVMPPGAASPSDLGRFIGRHRVTTMWLTAALFQRMVEDHLEGLRGVRQLLAGGDALSVSHVDRVLASGVLGAAGQGWLINGYGPTENTTFTCCHRMPSGSAVSDGVSIGRPIAQTRVYLVDRALRPVALGVVGELLAAGDGLARGYLNRPGLTAERFVPSPFAGEEGARLYRTGDLARFHPSGEIEFRGRFDHQIKVRGFRVEPGEIETVLSEHPKLRRVLVIAHRPQAGETQLVAYYTSDEPPPSLEELRGFLRETQPEYMIPAHFLALPEFPVSPNGKVDRGALPLPDGVRPDLERPYVAPRNEAEEVVAEIWREVLGLDRVGVHDDFFEIGGHSIAATRTALAIRERFGVELPLHEVFQRPTVAELVVLIEEAILEELEQMPDDELVQLT